MRVHLVEPDTPSVALTRVRHAFIRYAPPTVTFTDRESADLLVVPAIGRRDRVWLHVSAAQDRRQRVAIMQSCLRSTMSSMTSDWAEIWDAAECVWSYYDLRRWCDEDGVLFTLGDRFYHAPLGVDAETFSRPSTYSRPYIVCSSGRAWLTESARECSLAASALGRPSLHLGPRFKSRPWVTSVSGVTDDELADLYGQSEFVSGLRRVEGFELPVIEGVLCGARPVCFDQHHYRVWFGDFAEFIAEGQRADVLAALIDLFKTGARPVTNHERAFVTDRFHWGRLMRGFWERTL